MYAPKNTGSNSIRYRMMMRRLMLLLLTPVLLHAQTKFSGILYNKLDSTVIPFAAIRVPETGTSILSDTKGAFSFDVPGHINNITLSVTMIGCKTSLSYKRPFRKAEHIYIDLVPDTLNDVAIKGLSAEDVVRQAVKSIPVNYADSSYFSYSLYRYYERMNGRFINLIEAEPVVMFRLKSNRKEITANEAFAVRHMRRSRLRPVINGESNKEDLPKIMSENPIYHLAESSLAMGKFDRCEFNFDTTNRTRDYVISYVCKYFSSDSHGFNNPGSTFYGESWEKGRLVIDRGSFAIKRIQRQSIRNPKYNYPKNNNFVWPDLKYVAEFVAAEMEADYEQVNDKWYVKSICHKYTNNFIEVKKTEPVYTLTDVYEWYSVNRSKYITKDVADMFAAKEQSKKMKFDYDKQFWDAAAFPFHYDDKDSVYHDLERNEPLEDQFYAESRKTGN
ncbi:MAG: hypothetical protein JWQ38_56 [Flavipsychrobacter sp.]|nr:hypothetical protein [Flavipsychrobacter sp.]